MARQNSIIKIKGLIDDLSFYQTKDGHIVRKKTSVDGERIASDPNYSRVRENLREFATAAKAAKILRDALRPFLANCIDSRMSSRLNSLMSQIKNLDGISVRGSRNVNAGMASPAAKTLLKDFSFNKEAALSSVLYAPYVLTAANGNISFTNLKPDIHVKGPVEATHFRLNCAWAKVDFASGASQLEVAVPVVLPFSAVNSSSFTLTPGLIQAGPGIDLYLLKIEFYKEVNGVQYALGNRSYNTLSVIEAI